MKKHVAVLLCVYSGDRLDWFASAVRSILTQDYAEGIIRLYLGVDGSIPNDIRLWIEENESVFFRIVYNEENVGLGKTLNRLISYLEDEEFIFRMDADDISLPFRFKFQVEYLLANPEIDLLGSAIWEYDEFATVAWKRTYPCNHQAISSYLSKANPFAHSTVCFRRRFFSNTPRYPEASRYNQDLGLWYSALQHGVKMANLHIPLLCLRTNQAFYGRRGYVRAVSELRYYLLGIHSLYGLSWRMSFPFLRFLFRLMPLWLTRIIYKSSLRSRLS